MSTILEQKCPCCGGAVEFNTGVQKLKCPFCDTEFDITAMPEDTANQVEQISWNSQGSQWGAGETDGMSVYACNSCGGEIVADSTTGATTCPYCGNQVVMKGQFSGALRPDLVIPFKLDKKAAKEALKKHISTKKFVPKSFLADNRLEEIKGVYVPHWLFTCDAIGNANYKARSFFEGATPQNGYQPNTPYKITVIENPYSFDNENWATLYVQSGGADNPRPMKLRKKPSTGQWFLVDIQCLADIRVPVEEDPWA